MPELFKHVKILIKILYKKFYINIYINKYINYLCVRKKSGRGLCVVEIFFLVSHHFLV